MLLSDKQAQILFIVLRDSLRGEIGGVNTYSTDTRRKLCDAIVNQQSTELVEREVKPRKRRK